MDHIVAIACEHAPPPPAGTVVLRFAGAPQQGEQSFPLLQELHDISSNILKDRYAAWLYSWARDSGALDIATWEGGLSWWWFTPLSERSPQRSDIIHRLYQLLLLREVLQKHNPRRLTWQDTSRVMGSSVMALAAAHGCQTEVLICGKPSRKTKQVSLAVGRRLCAFAADFARAVVLRLMGARVLAQPEPQIILLTRFPILWERQEQGWREVMFGRLPKHLAQTGLSVAYAALVTGNPIAWLRELRSHRQALEQNRIFALQACVGLGNLISAHAMAGFWWRYLKWRRRQNRAAVVFDGIEVTRLLWREMDAMVLDPDLPSNRVVARAMTRLTNQWPGARFLMHPFEYQPFERAAWVGAKAWGDVTVVGLQTGLYTSGQLGFLLHRDELRSVTSGPTESRLAPVPDLLIAYGGLPAEQFARGVGASRVFRVGALRYGALAKLAKSPPTAARMRRELDLPRHLRPILVAFPAMPEEALPLLRGAVALAASRSDLFLMLKFHYHLRIDDTAAILADAEIPGRWRIFDTGLYDLIVAAEIVLTGATSACYEALALRRPAFVYMPPGRFHCNPAAETPAAFGFWYTQPQLEALFDEALSSSDRLTPSDQARDEALRQQMELDENCESRLMLLLRDRPSVSCCERPLYQSSR